MSVVQLAGRMGARAREETRQVNATAVLVLIPAGLLLVAGLMMILSASSVVAVQQGNSAFSFFARQLIWAAVGVGVLVGCASIDYRRWRGWGYALFAVSFIGLIAVLIPGIGINAGGSSRWLGAGPLRFQPSEAMKLGLLLVTADLVVRKGPRLRTVQDVVKPIGAIAGAVGILVMLQPDLGTTIILASLVYVILYVGGASLRVMTGMALAGGAAAVGLALSEGYRRARLFSFFDPFSDPTNTGYQAVQSMIALGSGGWTGVGLGASRQKWLYVPNAHTDFIFAIFGEETGIAGTMLVVGLFGLLAYAGVRVARRAPDAFGRLVASAITAWILGQAVVNMGAVTGLLPITGVPLPLLSFGGSALVFTMAAIGILVNIARHEDWPRAREDTASAPAEW